MNKRFSYFDIFIYGCITILFYTYNIHCRYKKISLLNKKMAQPVSQNSLTTQRILMRFSLTDKVIRREG